ncbi:hypothetical protein Tco_1040181 [Tanacetum coccineum]
MHSLFQGGNSTSRISALRSIEGRSKGGDDVGNSIGKSGGVPDGGIFDRGSSEGDIGNGGDTGSGGEGVWGSGDEYDVSGDGGFDGKARSLSTSSSERNGTGV